jgi:RNA polymerase sigma factor (sigma-70 family)
MDRKELTEQGLAIAESMAHRMFARFDHRVAFHDLQALARAAGLEAALRWDGRGVFGRYAVQRIKWAVLDGLRRKRERPLAGDGAAARQMAAEVLEKVADGLDADEDAISDQPEKLDAALRAFVGRSAAALTVELDAANGLVDPDADLDEAMDRLRVRRAVASLPEGERAVVERHAYEGETFDEIAAARGESRATVFSRYTRALERLRTAMETAA